MDIPYVGDQYLAVARSWERKLSEIPAEAGVLFVSVIAEPAPKGIVTQMDIFLGLSRKFELDLGYTLAKKYLSEELERGEFEIRITVVLGVAGPTSDGRVGGNPKSTDVRC
jgi:hypothetical protein